MKQKTEQILATTAPEGPKSRKAEKVEETELRSVNVGNLVKHGMHPRENIDDVESLENSIRIDGLQEPLLVNEVTSDTFEILDGVRRLQACVNLKFTEVECYVKKGLTPEEAGRVAYLKNVERASLSPVEIAKHLKRLKDNFNYGHRELSLRGYGPPSAITNSLKLLDLPNEVQDHIHAGRLTEAHGRELHKLKLQDEQRRKAREIIDHDWSVRTAKFNIAEYIKKMEVNRSENKAEVPETEIKGVYFKDASDMSELSDASIHLVLTSPPYGVGMEYEKDLSFHELMRKNLAVLTECSRVLVPGGNMVLNIGNINNFRNKKNNRECLLMGKVYQNFLRSLGIYLKDIIVWEKQIAWSKRNHLYKFNTPHTRYRIMDNFEPVYVFQKNGERQMPNEHIQLRSRLNKEEWKEYVKGVWKINTSRNTNGHPSEWPEELPSRLIKMFSFEGETVLDPFLGIGTTMKIAKDLNRSAVGYEVAIKYKPVIMKKLGLDQNAIGKPVKPAKSKPVSGKAREFQIGPDAVFFTNMEEMVKEMEAWQTNKSEPEVAFAGTRTD